MNSTPPPFPSTSLVSAQRLFESASQADVQFPEQVLTKSNTPAVARSAALTKANGVISAALMADDFPLFILILDHNSIDVNLCDDGISVYVDGDYPFTFVSHELHTCLALLRKFQAFNVRMDEPLTNLNNKILLIRKLWTRNSNYKEDAPDLKKQSGAYLEWAASLSQRELTGAVTAAFDARYKDKANEERGRIFGGICRTVKKRKRSAI